MKGSNKHVNISLNYVQWYLLQKLVLIMVQQCPIAEWELESYVIIELYKRHTYRLTVWEPNGNNEMTMALKFYEAHALNNFWCCHSDDYNRYLRQLIEPKFTPAREYETTIISINQ